MVRPKHSPSNFLIPHDPPMGFLKPCDGQGATLTLPE